jgi:glutathione S-transferase
LELNPYAKVPVLLDGDGVIYESAIINEYLDEKYPTPPLMPADPAKKAKARILIDYGLTHLDAPYQKLRMEMMKDEKDQNKEVIAAAQRELRKLLQRLENEIRDQPFLVGNFSLVDAALVPRFIRLEGFGVLPDTSLKKLGRYIERMKERPAVKAIL